MTEPCAAQSHRVHVDIRRPVEGVAALLSVRPSTWIKPFLRLAAHPAAVTERDLWFRLSRLVLGKGGGLTARLVWRPNIGADAFTVLTGELRLRGSYRATLELIGDSIGGQADRNTEMLRTLLSLLGAAVEGDSAQ